MRSGSGRQKREKGQKENTDGTTENGNASGMREIGGGLPAGRALAGIVAPRLAGVLALADIAVGSATQQDPMNAPARNSLSRSWPVSSETNKDVLALRSSRTWRDERSQSGGQCRHWPRRVQRDDAERSRAEHQD